MSTTRQARSSSCAAARRRSCWGGQIPASRTLNEALRSCVHRGELYPSSATASACERAHEQEGAQ